jgi:hypothetical protein
MQKQWDRGAAAAWSIIKDLHCIFILSLSICLSQLLPEEVERLYLYFIPFVSLLHSTHTLLVYGIIYVSVSAYIEREGMTWLLLLFTERERERDRQFLSSCKLFSFHCLADFYDILGKKTYLLHCNFGPWTDTSCQLRMMMM